jgi:hypothetical protein
MPRRKKDFVEQVVVEPVEKKVDNCAADEPIPLYMDRIDMLELALKEAQVGQLREQTEKMKLRETIMLWEQRAALGSLRSQIRDVEKQLQEYVDGYNERRALIQQKLGVDLKDYGIGDDGKLIKLPS